MRSYVLLTMACALAGSADAQFAQQGGKLVGTGAVGGAGMGTSVALSADGSTAIAGGPTDGDADAGAAWVYTRSAGVWAQQGSKLVGTGAVGGAGMGTSVALSADGNTAIVGWSSGAWVYTRSGGVWTQQAGNLVGIGVFPVALSADGNTAVVGGTVYTRSGGGWTLQARLPTGGPGALSADGNTAIVGISVYTRSGGVWTQQGSKLVGTGAVGDTSQGWSVALSGDGNTAIVGGPQDNASAGAAWVYTRSGGVWTQQGGKLVGTGAVGALGAEQGYSVALSGDGNTAIVGAPWDNTVNTFDPNYGAGGAWVYKRSGGAWTQQGSKLVGTGVVGALGALQGAEQGYSVAISSDGYTAIVGGPFDGPIPQYHGGYAGAAWVFVSPATSSGPSIASSGVVNGASFLPGMAPGTWITIQGTNLSTTTRTWNSSDFSGSSLPTQLDGVSVSVGGQDAYVSYISPTQINALAPNVGIGTVSVTVTDSSATSSAVAAVSQAVQPAFFQWGAYAVATRQDYSLAVKNGTFFGVTTTPAKPGDIIILWGNGFGSTSPAAPTGVVVPSGTIYYTASAVTVTVGSTAATVYGTALTPGYAGLYQVAVQIPTSLANGDYPVIATVAGAQSPLSTLITVQN